MDYFEKLLGDIESHSVEGINECFHNGVSPNDRFKGVPLIYQLMSDYARTPRFKDCVLVFIAAGLDFDDKALLAVLSDDAAALTRLLHANPEILNQKITFKCAYTPLFEANLLHICAEFNHLSCAKVLIKHGADVNAKAGIDQFGFGGQSPIFHTVNQNADNSASMMQYLLSKSADLKITVPGIIWGKGYEWETLVPAVNPISYAMMGLLPQMHRNEKRIAQVVSELLKIAYGIDYVSENIPCAYLKKQ